MNRVLPILCSVLLAINPLGDYGIQYLVSEFGTRNINDVYKNERLICNSENEDLLIGHSLVTGCYKPILDNHIKLDVIGIGSGTFKNITELSKYIGKEYNNVFLWIGCNDINTYEFDKIKVDFDTMVDNITANMKYKKLWILTDPETEYNLTHDINNVLFNDYLLNNYVENIIIITEKPDSDKVHFQYSTYVKILNRITTLAKDIENETK